MTKHQRLAIAIKQRFAKLDAFFAKVVQVLDILQLHFYERAPIFGCINMTEGSLKVMAVVQKLWLQTFSPIIEVRKACSSKPLMGTFIDSSFKLRSLQIPIPTARPSTAHCPVPWGFRVILPSESKQLLKRWRDEALLYCASEKEMPEWIDWSEKWDQVNTLMNHLCFIVDHRKRLSREQEVLRLNLLQPAFPYFMKMANDRGDVLPSSLQKPKSDNFIPKHDSTVAEAYEMVVSSLISREHQHNDLLPANWKTRLEELIFEDLYWPPERRCAFIEEWMDPKISKIGSRGVLWKTSPIIDITTYTAFIEYFAHRFLENPRTKPIEGEIVCLLWLILSFEQDQIIKTTLQSILNITTEHFENQIIHINGQEIELSEGLGQILQAYVGNKPARRHQKLFSNLTVGNLEDCFRKASLELLPKDSSPVLPNAFFLFPHCLWGLHMDSSIRRKSKLPKKFCEGTSSRQ